MKRDDFRDFVLDQLEELGPITCRAMFGGSGLYLGPAFFAIVYKERLYFKTDEESRQDYRRRQMKPFRPNARQTLKTYYQVPVEILEDSDQLVVWASRAVAAQHNR